MLSLTLLLLLLLMLELLVLLLLLLLVVVVVGLLWFSDALSEAYRVGRLLPNSFRT